MDTTRLNEMILLNSSNIPTNDTIKVFGLVSQGPLPAVIFKSINRVLKLTNTFKFWFYHGTSPMI